MKRQVSSYFTQHLRALLGSLGTLCRTPFASSMTLLVIAIALALPAGLYLLVHNIESITSAWQNGAQLSLFVNDDISDERALLLSQEIGAYPGVSHVHFLTREAAFNEFKNLSGFSIALETLPNPLPPVIIVYPSFTDPILLEKMQQELQQLPELARVQLDLAWVQRLAALLHLGERMVLILMSFLGFAVVLIIGNTIRVSILNRQEEIAVVKLVGGTNAFIRRPFLYTGVWYGFLGALLALLMITGALFVLQHSVNLLATAYQSEFQLRGLGFSRSIDVLLLGMTLGWLGAAIFLHYHLKQITPK